MENQKPAIVVAMLVSTFIAGGFLVDSQLDKASLEVVEPVKEVVQVEAPNAQEKLEAVEILTDTSPTWEELQYALGVATRQIQSGNGLVIFNQAGKPADVDLKEQILDILSE